jgi:predicted RNA-binding protein with PIN domain
MFNNCFCLSKERNVEKVKIRRDKRFREIQNSMHAMEIKIDEQFQTKLDDLNGKMININFQSS